jgi:hypothetical protein
MVTQSRGRDPQQPSCRKPLADTVPSVGTVLTRSFRTAPFRARRLDVETAERWSGIGFCGSSSNDKPISSLAAACGCCTLLLSRVWSLGFASMLEQAISQRTYTIREP